MALPWDSLLEVYATGLVVCNIQGGCSAAKQRKRAMQRFLGRLFVALMEFFVVASSIPLKAALHMSPMFHV